MASKISLRQRLEKLPVAVSMVPLIVTVNVFFVGLTWGHADHYSQVPTLWNRQNPSYLADDWYIQTLGHLNVRGSFLHLTAPIAKAIGTPAFYLLLQVMLLAAMTWSLASIASRLFGEGAAWWVAMAGMLATVGNNIGWVALWSYIARPKDVGHALLLLAVAFWLGRRHLVSGFFLGLAIDCQPLMGGWGAVLLGMVHVLARTRQWGRLLVMVAAATATAIPALSSYSPESIGLSGTDRALVMDAYLYRLLGRASAALWEWDVYVASAGFVLALVALLPDTIRVLSKETRREAKWLCLVPGVVFLVAIPVSILVPASIFAQPLLVSVWPRVVVLVMIGAWFSRLWSRGPLSQLLVAPAVASLFSGPVVFASFWFVAAVFRVLPPTVRVGGRIIFWGREMAAYTPAPPAVATETLALANSQQSPPQTLPVKNIRIMIANAGAILVLLLLPSWAETRSIYMWSAAENGVQGALVLAGVLMVMGWRLDFRRPEHAWGSVLLLLGLLALRLPGGPLGPEDEEWTHVQIRLVSISAEEAAAKWCNKYLPRNSRMLVPPHFVAGRLFAKRAVVVDLKCFPFGAADAVEWRRRVLEVCGFDPATTRMSELKPSDLARGYERQSPEKILELARKYDAQVFIATQGAAYPFQKIKVKSGWVIYQLPDLRHAGTNG